MAPILRAEGLGKAFLHRGRHPVTLRGFVEGGWRRARTGERFWALRDVGRGRAGRDAGCCRP